MSASRLTLPLEDGAAFDTLRAEVASHGGLMVPLAGADVPLQSDVEVKLIAPPEREVVAVHGRVVQHIGGEAVVLLDEENQERVLDAEYPTGIAYHHEEAEGGEAAPAEDAEDEEEADGKARRGSGIGPPELKHGVPLWAQYAELGKGDRIKLARYGNADARRLVLKDRDQSLHAFVLSNPGLTAKELVALIRNKQASPALISRILERSDLMSNISVQEALVFNPHTPTQDAVKLVPKIPLDAARRIVKAQGLRGPIVRAARKRVHRGNERR
jgi:hypothetical protein